MEEKCSSKLSRYSVWGIKRGSEKNQISKTGPTKEFYLTDSEEENEKWGNKFGEIEQESSDDENPPKDQKNTTGFGTEEITKTQVGEDPEMEEGSVEEQVDLKKISSNLLEIA